MLSAGGYGHLFPERYRRKRSGGLRRRRRVREDFCIGHLSPGTILNSFCLVIGHFPPEFIEHQRQQVGGWSESIVMDSFFQFLKFKRLSLVCFSSCHQVGPTWVSFMEILRFIALAAEVDGSTSSFTIFPEGIV